MQIIRTGYCPFKAKKASINIDYIDSQIPYQKARLYDLYIILYKNKKPAAIFTF